MPHYNVYIVYFISSSNLHLLYDGVIFIVIKFVLCATSGLIILFRKFWDCEKYKNDMEFIFWIMFWIEMNKSKRIIYIYFWFHSEGVFMSKEYIFYTWFDCEKWNGNIPTDILLRKIHAHTWCAHHSLALYLGFDVTWKFACTANKG